MEKLLSIIEYVVREARIRWRDVRVDRVKEARSKYYVYMVVSGYNVKAIVYKYRFKVRVYSRLKGLSIALQRIFERGYRRVLRESGGV